MIDQFNDDFGDFGESQDRIEAPVEARYHRAIELHFFFQGAADRLDDVAFDLVSETVGIDDQTTVVGDDNALSHIMTVSRIHFHVGHRGDVSFGPVVAQVSRLARMKRGVSGVLERTGRTGERAKGSLGVINSSESRKVEESGSFKGQEL